MFHNAIVRIPGENFAQGLTTAQLGAPDYQKTMQQHQKYCEALQKCGLTLTMLEPDLRYPDSTFVEDTAIVTERCAILTNPGADSRKGEVSEIQEALSKYYPNIYTISPPGTLDGGDICEADGHFFIGISERTNETGACQLAEYLASEGYTASFVKVTGIPNVLHLKSGIAYLGDDNLILIDAFSKLEDFQGYNIIHVKEQENYAANCIQVNSHILLPAGFPHIQKTIEHLGYSVIPLDMSEFQKMDGGLSCLSLRF